MSPLAWGLVCWATLVVAVGLLLWAACCINSMEDEERR